MIIDTHTFSHYRLSSISDINQLIDIDFYRLLLIFIDYRNYRLVWPGLYADV
jgi:hypothetical protein